ncbi:MAG: glycine cleavage system aminomethyltransferase GcvT [Actinomycetota bacterium]
MGLTTTPLDEYHRALGAKMGEFAGWAMPIEYEGVLGEHRAVREGVGLFDLTHLGKIEVSGPAAITVLQRSLSNDISKVEVGRAQYNLVLTTGGGIVDDLIAYRLDEDRFLVVPNAANTEKVLRVLEDDRSKGATVAHRPDLVTIAVQGPGSLELVPRFFSEGKGLPYMHSVVGVRDGEEVVVARSGYTGEPGYELFLGAPRAVDLWRELLDAGESMGVKPCGLGARDTLRLEMGYPLHGNDISEETNPIEAGLSWAVAWEKGDFRGREPLSDVKEKGPQRRLRGLRMTGRLIPRPHYGVYRGENRVGETTSGTFSPTLRIGIALGYLDPSIEPGDVVEIDVRGRRGEAEVVKPPFVDRNPK